MCSAVLHSRVHLLLQSKPVQTRVQVQLTILHLFSHCSSLLYHEGHSLTQPECLQVFACTKLSFLDMIAFKLL
jgi:hypothetical protein